MLVLQAETMGNEIGTRTALKQVLDHIGLDDNHSDFSEKLVASYKAPMKNHTRLLLETFYKPYNKRLNNLLGVKWNDPWPAIMSV